MPNFNLRWYNGILQQYVPTFYGSDWTWQDVPTVMTHGNTSVEIKQGWVETTLPGGAKVNAVPMLRSEDIARAESLGYTDVWEMTKDHDRFHAMLCDLLELPESPALRQALLGESSELAGAEEQAVLAMQRFINLARKAGFVK